MADSNDEPRNPTDGDIGEIGDTAAVERLLADCWNDVWRAARSRTRCDADADDVALEAVARFWQAAEQGRLDEHPDARGYLFRTVRNLAIDHSREASRRGSVASHDRSDEPDEPPVTVATDSLDEAVEILQRLPANQRASLMLVDGQELSHEEAGRQLQMHPNAVRQLRFRARRRLRLEWARHVTGPRRSPRCDDTTLRLFADIDDTTALDHALNCERCTAVRERLVERRRQRRLDLLPIPGLLKPTDRRKATIGVAATGAIAASMVAVLGTGSADRPHPPSSSSPSQIDQPYAASATTTPTPSTTLPARRTNTERSDIADDRSLPDAAPTDETTISSPRSAVPPPEAVDGGSERAEHQPHLVEISVEIDGLPPLRLGVVPTPDDGIALRIP